MSLSISIFSADHLESKASAHNALFTLVMSPREFMSAITLFLSLFLTGKQIQILSSGYPKDVSHSASQEVLGSSSLLIGMTFFFLFLPTFKGKKKKEYTSLRFAGSYFKKCEKLLIIFVTGRSRGHCRSRCV